MKMALNLEVICCGHGTNLSKERRIGNAKPSTITMILRDPVRSLLDPTVVISLPSCTGVSQADLVNLRLTSLNFRRSHLQSSPKI